VIEAPLSVYVKRPKVSAAATFTKQHRIASGIDQLDLPEASLFPGRFSAIETKAAVKQ
jgi:hypothetical protein